MLSEKEIESVSDDLIVADRIVERVKLGTVAGREMMADEVDAFIRAYVLMRSLAEKSASFMHELHKRELQGLDVSRD